MPTPPLLIACDFDGTLTRQDTLVEILNRYGDPRWQEVQKKVVSGEISIREGLQREMGSVRASPEEIRSLLADRIEVDPTFPPFLREMRQRGIPVVCLSGGFDLCIETVLAKAGLWPLPMLANRLLRENGGWRVEYPYPSLHCPDCGHCKGDPIREWNDQGYQTAFVGNGVTDRCAARSAKITFAKDELAAWCLANQIQATSYRTFDEIRETLSGLGRL